MSDGSDTHAHGAIDFAEAAGWFREHAEAETEEYRRLARRLSRPEDAVLVDVGCGAAGMALALARSHPDGRVVAVDAEPEMIAIARERAAEAGLPIEAEVVDLGDGERLAEVVDGPADFIWAGHVVHHAVDQQGAVDMLAQILAPGGRLALGEGGIAPRYLPWDVGVGRPGLELRLAEAASRRLEADQRAHAAQPVPYGWNIALERAGLVEVRELNDVVALPAPLEGRELEAAVRAMTHRLEWFEDFLDAEDQAAWEALLDPESPHWVGARRDLHKLEVRTMYLGVKP